MKDSEVIRELAQSDKYREVKFMCTTLDRCSRADLFNMPFSAPLAQIQRLQDEIAKRIAPFGTLTDFLANNRDKDPRDVPFAENRAYYMRMARQLEKRGK